MHAAHSLTHPSFMHSFICSFTSCLCSVFDQIGERAHESNDREHELARQLEARIAQLEAGDEEVGSIPSLGGGLSDEDAMYAYIIENSRLLGTHEETPTPSPPEPFEAATDLSDDASALDQADLVPVPPPVELVLQNQVWA
jgi:hypothetical protein